MAASYDLPDRLIVFDLGGTWFRSAVLAGERQLLENGKSPAITYINHPEFAIEHLQEKLVEYVVEETNRLIVSGGGDIKASSLSVGAAIDGRTGHILNAGPLWGPNSRPFDLKGALRRRTPNIEWHIVNDVTAALLRHVHAADFGSAKRIALITVSTGIAARTYDVASASVPLDRFAGLQGEIGHVPVVFAFRTRTYDLNCDCGGANHLNAFSSGRGMARVIRHLAAADTHLLGSVSWSKYDLQNRDEDLVTRFSLAIRNRDQLACEIFDAMLAPLARTILAMLATDPLLERFILIGGVVRALSPFYLCRLREMIARMGVYQISALNPEFVKTLLVPGIDDDASGLIGAGISFYREASQSLLS